MRGLCGEEGGVVDLKVKQYRNNRADCCSHSETSENILDVSRQCRAAAETWSQMFLTGEVIYYKLSGK